VNRPVFAFALVVLTACSGAGVPLERTPAASTTTTTIPPTPEGGAAAFNSCVEEAGADLPELTVDSEGRPRLALLVAGVEILDPAVRGALARCSALLTESGALTVEGDLRNRVMGVLREFSQCMREEGMLAFPDPAPGFAGEGDPFPLDEVIRSAPGFSAAADTCATRLADR